MENNKIEKYINQIDFYIRFLFIFTSLLCMSSIIYDNINVLYKILTIFLICTELTSVYINIRKDLYDKKFILGVSLLILTNIISALINYRTNLVGNMVEVLFMFSYCFIMILYNSKNIDKIFKNISYAVQIISFISALFGIFLFLFRIVLALQIKETVYFYGFYNGRLWGLVNPNASAILGYTSVILALFLLHSGTKFKKIIKINLAIQVFYFALQQSRGAILSAILMITIYFLFIKDGKIFKKILLAVCVSSIFISGIFGINFISTIYVNSFETNIININSIKTDEVEKLKDPKAHIRIAENTPSGRTYIWKQAIKMGTKKPIFGYGNRNLISYFKVYFDKYVINNSLKGGGFHNIFITVFVSTGLIGLISFSGLILYMTFRFLKYLVIGRNKDNKLLITLVFGILFGQLFESQIMYSTNFINIIFWTTLGYSIYLIKNEEHIEYREITDIKELQKIELEILDYIHNICEKIGVKYYLAYGTLIGAIRHRGFIPWDDDLDICMLRNDYEKFQEHLLKNPDEKYTLMSYLNNNNYVYPFMKIIDSSTYLVEDDVRIDSKMGVYVDIFPIDGYEKDVDFNKKMTKLIKKRQLSCYTFRGIRNKNSIFDTIIRYLCVILFSITDTTKYVREIDELAKSRNIDDYENANYLIYKDMNKPDVNKKCFIELIKHNFCNKEYYIPKYYDELLRSDYGDYMQLPPIEQRKTHHNFKVWKIIKK